MNFVNQTPPPNNKAEEPQEHSNPKYHPNGKNEEKERMESVQGNDMSRNLAR